MSRACKGILDVDATSLQTGLAALVLDFLRPTHRESSAVVLEPAREWPANWIDSFAGVPDDFERPDQGAVDNRRKL